MKNNFVLITAFTFLFSYTNICLATDNYPAGSKSTDKQTGVIPAEPVEARSFQLSLVPFVGTEGAYAAENVYNISLNILGGVTGGVDGLELGGILNINRFSMTGLQGSGFGNFVDGPVKGLQMAGFLNVNNAFTQGLQGAGFGNVINGDARVLQGAGFGNIINGDMEGIQGAGFGNIVTGNMEGIQGAGFGNITAGNSVFQAAGFGNITGGKVTGVQIAGFGNIANEVEGIQMAGFFNIAGNVKGIQLGFINIADSIDGIPFGFISIVKHGYRKLEISSGEALNLGVSFKIGVRRFYNIFSVATHFAVRDPLLALGYGIGSEFNMPDDRRLNAEILSHRFLEDRWWEHNRMNMLHQLKVNYSRPLGDRWQVFAGPALNFLTTRDGANNDLTDIAPYELFSFQVRDHHTRVWLGINAGVRFW